MRLSEWLRQDWPVNTPPFSRMTVTIYRFGQWCHSVRAGVALRPLWFVLDLVWVKSLMGAELPPSVPAGPGLCLPHGGRGVIVHEETQLGAGVTLYHRTTLGRRDFRPEAAPKLGDHVYVGTGAVVMGGVTVGHGARIGANAVVHQDVPAGAVAVGVPAVIRERGPVITG